ncbi:hypothetical protein HAX54_016694, partial [Datura stramonium]|nr:hypothetical protein [Datura stramonium]
ISEIRTHPQGTFTIRVTWSQQKGRSDLEDEDKRSEEAYLFELQTISKNKRSISDPEVKEEELTVEEIRHFYQRNPIFQGGCFVSKV